MRTPERDPVSTFMDAVSSVISAMICAVTSSGSPPVAAYALGFHRVVGRRWFIIRCRSLQRRSTRAATAQGRRVDDLQL